MTTPTQKLKDHSTELRDELLSKRPATPLPWDWQTATKTTIQMSDLQYAAHAANSYPRLVAALRELIGPAEGGYADGYPDDGEVEAAKSLLRSLGESE
jgi:hypothetical protein